MSKGKLKKILEDILSYYESVMEPVITFLYR